MIIMGKEYKRNDGREAKGGRKERREVRLYTCINILWIFSDSSWMSGSRGFISAPLGAVKMSSLRGLLQKDKTRTVYYTGRHTTQREGRGGRQKHGQQEKKGRRTSQSQRIQTKEKPQSKKKRQNSSLSSEPPYHFLAVPIACPSDNYLNIMCCPKYKKESGVMQNFLCRGLQYIRPSSLSVGLILYIVRKDTLDCSSTVLPMWLNLQAVELTCGLCVCRE